MHGRCNGPRCCWSIPPAPPPTVPVNALKLIHLHDVFKKKKLACLKLCVLTSRTRHVQMSRADRYRVYWDEALQAFHEALYSGLLVLDQRSNRWRIKNTILGFFFDFHVLHVEMSDVKQLTLNMNEVISLHFRKRSVWWRTHCFEIKPSIALHHYESKLNESYWSTNDESWPAIEPDCWASMG